MHQPVETPQRKSIEGKVADIRKWIAGLIVPQKTLGNFPVCPFASTAQFKIEECLSDDIVPCDEVQVVIFIMNNEYTIDQLQLKSHVLGTQYPDYIFLDDHKDEDSFIDDVKTNNGMYNLIIVQKKNELLAARKILHKTEYYTYWTEEFYNHIMKG